MESGRGAGLSMIDLKRYMTDAAYRAGVDDARKEAAVNEDDLAVMQAGNGAALRTAMTQRETYKQQRDAALGLIKMMGEEAAKASDKAEREIQEVSSRLQPLIDQGPLRQLPHQLARILNDYNGPVAARINSYSQSLRTLNDPVIYVQRVMEIIRLTGFKEAVVRQIDEAHAFSHDPAMIADEVMRECESRADHTPPLDKIMLLPIEWIKSNLPDPPGTHETLQRGLQIRRAEMFSRGTRAEFAKS